MFGKQRQANAGPHGPLLTIMGQTAQLQGKFNIADSIQIECEIAGEINVEGKLIVGEKGVVRADVHTADALIKGCYDGNMVATGNVEITSTGRVSGNIETDSLVISKGGFFNGNVIKIKRGPEITADRRGMGPTLVEQKTQMNQPPQFGSSA